GKLTKAYEKHGRQYGVVELTITMPVTALINDDTKTQAKDAKLVIRLQRDGPIDGSLGATRFGLTFDGDIKGTLNANGMDFGLEVTIRGRAEELREPTTKK
ncbi:MAG: hypothetical protein NZO58_14260, partial [Gemmataceae bacterium]|nr:hypothetical protein [Gemmataceae bacterium]